MTIKYTQQQIDKVLEKLPEELKEALFSAEAAENVWQACTKQKITDERMTNVAEYTGYVLMGLLPPQEFLAKLQKEIKLSKEVAEEISREINRFIFYPVKPALEQLYKTEVAPSEETLKKEGEIAKENTETPSAKDIYRETVE